MVLGHFVTPLTPQRVVSFFEGLIFHTNLLTAVSTHISRNNQEEKSPCAKREDEVSSLLGKSGLSGNRHELVPVDHLQWQSCRTWHYLHHMHYALFAFTMLEVDLVLSLSICTKHLCIMHYASFEHLKINLIFTLYWVSAGVLARKGGCPTSIS